MNPLAVGRAKEKGAFQIREKFWGKVPVGTYDQALQNERVLNVLVKEKKSLIAAIAAYN